MPADDGNSLFKQNTESIGLMLSVVRPSLIMPTEAEESGYREEAAIGKCVNL